MPFVTFPYLCLSKRRPWACLIAHAEAGPLRPWLASVCSPHAHVFAGGIVAENMRGGEIKRGRRATEGLFKANKWKSGLLKYSHRTHTRPIRPDDWHRTSLSLTTTQRPGSMLILLTRACFSLQPGSDWPRLSLAFRFGRRPNTLPQTQTGGHNRSP